ncbi:probable E3 ubiquitin-protein ligase BAH1-like [Punica granatum]|uniref:RING-type E3 ubiquitin transferase n=1 Tax=Punica granatum TaxID=22663 RepID=A0A6P8DM90_PUNGR|nr:probable E3 ubiquitin-protein ligase BAH1-like [Punica granatum]
MKFEEMFTEYLHGDQERFLDKCSHVEYKRLKEVLKSCRSCKHSENSCSSEQESANGNEAKGLCQCESCPFCDQKFFTELMKEASDVAGCFRIRVRHLLHLHMATGMQKYIKFLRHCFRDDQQLKLQEGRVLIQYITINAIAIRKILKKYDKVHGSTNGENFRSKMRAKHLELLQSPWLIELGAFFMNIRGSNAERSQGSNQYSFDFDAARPVMTMSLLESAELEYDLTCAICLDTVFNPYALSCGHLFCKLCARSAASMMIFQGLKAASPNAKCPVCREAGVYANSVHMLELNLLLKNRCKEYWKERMIAERAEIVKQYKEYCDFQTKYAIGHQLLL